MSLATRHTSPSLLARLVSKQWSERRDDGHESGISEVLNHCLDVLVGGGRFLVEQVALFADDATTDPSLRKFSNAEALAHANSGFAARPLAAYTMCQRPSMAFAITCWFY